MGYLQIPSRQLGRNVHVWQFGHFGMPVLVFPSAAGFAHEWKAQGMVEALEPLLLAGRIKLYCPESNVAEAWTRHDSDPRWRIQRHQAYEDFILETFVPYIEEDCRTAGIPITTTGCSLGALYAANMTLKHPERFPRALCMSGRYRVGPITGGYYDADVYYNDPLSYVPNLSGEALDRVRQKAHLTVVCGQGAFENGCIQESIELAGVLDHKGIPHERDIWGRDSAHQWPWWRRQALYHLTRMFGR